MDLENAEVQKKEGELVEADDAFVEYLEEEEILGMRSVYALVMLIEVGHTLSARFKLPPAGPTSFFLRPKPFLTAEVVSVSSSRSW